VTTVSNEVLEAERRAHRNTLRKLEEASNELDMLYKKIKESDSQLDKVSIVIFYRPQAFLKGPQQDNVLEGRLHHSTNAVERRVCV
jgi:hypothetical protein